jgi:hypothetical protein
LTEKEVEEFLHGPKQVDDSNFMQEEAVRHPYNKNKYELSKDSFKIGMVLSLTLTIWRKKSVCLFNV